MARSFTWWIFGFAVTAVGRAAFAQPCLPTPITPSYIVPSPKAHQPFTATVRFSREQKLIDGNTIRGAVTLRVARDGSGRTHWESPAGCLSDGNNEPEQILRTIVFDPATREVETWWAGGASRKIVNVVRQLPPESQIKVSVQQLQAQTAAQRAQKSEHGEKLGNRVIAGQTAEGMRFTRTIPASQIGSDFPVVSVQEIWRAKNFDIVMLRTNDDPRSGHTSIEVTEFKAGEPAPELFQAPSDYAVQEERITPPEVGKKPE